MAKRIIIQSVIFSFAFAAIFYPLFVRFQNVVWESGVVLLTLFPFFGLLAFTILWLHVLSGVFEPFLRKYIAFDAWVHYSSLVVLASIVAHPLFLLISLDFKFRDIFIFWNPFYLWLGILGFALLIIYDIGKALQQKHFFVRNWNRILFVSTIGILLIFFHSIGLGSDLRENPLRSVWMFYGITAVVATIYNFGLKKLPEKGSEPH